jgi:hypothetical protein
MPALCGANDVKVRHTVAQPGVGCPATVFAGLWLFVKVEGFDAKAAIGLAQR